MDDDQIRDRIEAFEAEEKKLRAQEADAAETGHDDVIAADAQRLAEIRIQLAQFWDLLRQRKAKRNAGEDPDTATLRDQGTVEDYLG
jgi:Protein of unknown function (DUF2630)